MPTIGEKECELCDVHDAHYDNFPFVVNDRLYRGQLCKRCARLGPDEMMAEQEAIEFLQSIYDEGDPEWQRLEEMKGGDFGTIEV